MKISYRKAFLKDLKKLKKELVYDDIFELAFTMLPKIETLREIPSVKAMSSCSNRYRIRIGDYRIGIELNGDMLELVRVLHRREFYRYFP